MNPRRPLVTLLLGAYLIATLGAMPTAAESALPSERAEPRLITVSGEATIAT